MLTSGDPLRVVLDTNLIVSALMFGGGLPGRLRRRWQQRAFLPLVCTATADELIRVLAYPKFRLTRPEREELLADYLPFADMVTVPECRDPYDIPFLHLAIAGNTTALVTGDRDLLALADVVPASGFRILTPADFAETLAPPARWTAAAARPAINSSRATAPPTSRSAPRSRSSSSAPRIAATRRSSRPSTRPR